MMDEDDGYIFYGTELPDIDDEVTLKKRAARELQVRDEKGRQRFHGAFTGGFSAGYFNTVGTKEGWAPSSFVSSRSKVAERLQQNPEDFMDDEDLGEFGIASRRIHTTSSFQDKADIKSQKRRHFDNDSVIPGEAPLKDIVQPVCESIGIQILRKLGWKHGQGIGPRVKRQQPGPKVYGCSLFPDAAEKEEEDSTAQLFTFAPQDTESIFYKPKDDYFGLGYKGLSKESVLNARPDPFSVTSTKSFLAKEKKKIKISGQAFGVGAFEDDDEDIYRKDDLSQYDFSDLALLGSKDTPVTEPKKTKRSDEIIDGFCLGLKPLISKKIYPPPLLPPNFKPVHLKSSRNTLPNQGAANAKSHHSLSAPDRSLILGEKKFIQASFKDVAPIPVEKTLKQPIHLQRTTSLNFRPFPNDAAKQQRYESYLKLKEQGDVGELVQPSSMTEWEKQQEIEEFAKASVFFQPLNNVLSSRFESKSHLSVEHEVMSELEKLKKAKELKPIVPVKRKLIGTSNRKSFEWHPVSLLCKRMNVPNPYPNESSGVGQGIKSSSVFDHLHFSETLLSNKTKDLSQATSSTAAKASKESENKPPTPPPAAAISNIATTSENPKESPSENTKPPIDFFKAIFANSSDEESEDEETNQSNSSKEPDRIISEKKSPKNSFENKSEMPSVDSNYKNNAPAPQKVGFGVFANLDLDALNERKAVKPSIPQNPATDNEEMKNDKEPSKSAKTVDDSLKKIDEWTPELPPNFKIPRSPVSNDLKIEPIHSDKHKSKHHHKHKHHKHKSKKKKKKKHESSSESEDDIDDVPPTLIIQKLKELQKKKHSML